MSVITVCDIDGCEEPVVWAVNVTADDHEWLGMDADLCGTHTLNDLLKQWKKTSKELKSETGDLDVQDR